MQSYCLSKNDVALLLLLCGMCLMGSYQFYNLHHKVEYLKNANTARIEPIDIGGELVQIDTKVVDRIVYYGYSKNTQNKNRKNMLDGCYHVYLDAGSNIGAQVRKLFEPKRYPQAYVHSIFC